MHVAQLLSLYAYMCINIYIYIYTHVYIYIYIYISPVGCSFDKSARVRHCTARCPSLTLLFSSGMPCECQCFMLPGCIWKKMPQTILGQSWQMQESGYKSSAASACEPSSSSWFSPLADGISCYRPRKSCQMSARLTERDVLRGKQRPSWLPFS